MKVEKDIRIEVKLSYSEVALVLEQYFGNEVGCHVNAFHSGKESFRVEFTGEEESNLSDYEQITNYVRDNGLE